MDCLFCKIIAKELPADVVYEDDAVLAFLDIHPVNPGHTLVIPKTHSQDMADADDLDFVAVMRAVKKIAPAIVSAVGASAYNIGINQGAVAGQMVMHLHVHIMPRFPDDGRKLWHALDISAEERAAIGQKIRVAVAG